MSERSQAKRARLNPPNAAAPVTATVKKVPTSSGALVSIGSSARGGLRSPPMRRPGDNSPPTTALADCRRGEEGGRKGNWVPALDRSPPDRVPRIVSGAGWGRLFAGMTDGGAGWFLAGVGGEG